MSNEAQKMQQDLGLAKEVVLKYPARLPTGETLSKVTVRRPRVGDVRAVAHIGNETEQGLAVLARVTGLVPEDLDLLDLEDLQTLQACFPK